MELLEQRSNRGEFMILNNIFALFMHILLIVLSTIGLSVLVAISPYLGGLITSLPFRIIIAVFWILAYLFIGTRLKVKHRPEWDFKCGILIALAGIALFIYSLYKIGPTIEITEELSYYAIPLSIYLNPIYQIFLMLGISFNQPMRFVSCFIPTFLIGVGLKLSRFKRQGVYQKS